MIQCVVYDATGKNKVGTVVLDIRKSAAGFKLQQALWDRGSEVIPRHLEMLDCGTLPLSVLSRVYSAAEIRKSIVRHTEDLRKSAAEADAILDRIEADNLWDKGGLRKSKSGYTGGRGHDADEVIKALHEYKYVDVSGKREVFAHPEGHTCRVKRDGSWSHSGATGRVVAGSGAAELRRRLASIHGVL
jgi:hypothetical protein